MGWLSGGCQTLRGGHPGSLENIGDVIDGFTHWAGNNLIILSDRYVRDQPAWDECAEFSAFISDECHRTNPYIAESYAATLLQEEKEVPVVPLQPRRSSHNP